MIQYDYAYDLINQPFLSEVIDPTSGKIIQSFMVPPDVGQLLGARVKLSKIGNPGGIWFGLGRSPGSSDLAQGEIPGDEVMPVFELWNGINFPPVNVSAGETCYLSLQVLSGNKPLDAYRIYGPNIFSHTGGPESASLPYWWTEGYEASDEIEISLPYDYRGAAYPDYQGGARYRQNGEKTWSISLTILTDEKEFFSDEEERFAFTRKLLAPPFSEWTNARDPSVIPGTDTVQIDGGWQIRSNCINPLAQNAIDELKVFLERVMDITFFPSGNRTIDLIVEPEAEIPIGEESFIARIHKNHVQLTARHERGLLRAVHWVEDAMLVKKAPLLEPGDFRLKIKYSPRLAPAIYPSPSYFQLQEATIWTPGYMWRFARAGYNAIYLPANIEEFIEDSQFFPEMNDRNASIAIEHLRQITELASTYGVDVYLDLKTGYCRKFNDAVYERLPEIRSYERFGNYPCSGQKIVLDFYQETLANVFEKVQKLKGIIVIYDTEGFFSCFIHNQQHKCSYCKDFNVTELSTRLFSALKAGIHASRPDTDLILWSYFCDEPWNYEVIRAMPMDAILMSCYSQFVELNRFGVHIRTDDYSICSEKPSDYFQKMQTIASEKGLRFFCKTEDTFGQEFVSTPYTPSLQQHQRRWDALSKFPVDGFLSQYIHLGFLPGPCPDLMRQNIYDITKDGHPANLTADEKLQRVARLWYGTSSEKAILKAWDAFSTAIHDYFPYTWGVCRYPGPLQAAPAQPFNLDPTRRVPRLRSRGYVRNLKWTGIEPRFLVDPAQTWNAALVSRCFQGFLKNYDRGIDWLELACHHCEPQYENAIESLLRIARTQALQARSLINLIQFFQIRESFQADHDPVLQQTLIYVCENELENATQALKICQQDSLIGFSCEGAGNVRGGSFTPTAIQQKISGLEKTLRDLYSFS